MQYTAFFFSDVKNEFFIRKFLIILMYLLKIFIGGSNEYPQSMFWIKNKKNSFTK